MTYIHLRLQAAIRNLRHPARALVWLALSSGCADGSDAEEAWDEPTRDAQGTSPSFDAGVGESPQSATPPTSSARPQTGTSAAPASTSQPSNTSTSAGSSTSSSSASAGDAGARPNASQSDAGGGADPVDDLLGGLFGGGTSAPAPATGDAGAGSGGWKLTADSDQECPPEPPPIPIVGGACLGLYYICNWENAAGETYTCTCDWVHWLCL